MKILFLLYGDFTTNTAGPLVLFTKELTQLGHECVIAVPHNVESAQTHDCSSFMPILYEEVLQKNGTIFSGGQRADVIHACTPRVFIFNFLRVYLSKWPSPLVIYLEDNESWIVKSFLGLDNQAILSLSDVELASRVPPSLSHPFEYPFLVALADLVILIQEKLKVEVPEFIPTRVIPWGADQSVFSPSISPSTKWREICSINPREKVLVYHGGLNGFNREAMLDLCIAIQLINEAGVECKLIRTGPNPINFWDELGPNARDYILELGVVPKQELPSILALADVFVQPGRIDEFEDLRLPSKLPEFLSMGKPVILPDVNIADLFHNNENAIILSTGEPVEIASACLAIFKDDLKSIKLAQGAREFAKKEFNIIQQAKKLEAAYLDAIKVFNLDRTRAIWKNVRDNGVVDAALMRANFAITDFGVNPARLACQMIKWCQVLDARLKVGSNAKAVNGNDSSSTGKSLFKLMRNFLNRLIS